VNWGRFLPLVLLLMAVSGVLAVFMDWLFQMGQYYIFLVPAICALVLAGMGLLAVAYGHCRSRWLAVLIGGIAGLALYLEYYHVGMVRDLGPEAAYQFQSLPDYIRWRKQVETTEDVGAPRQETEAPPAPGRFDVVMNWVLFGAELLVSVGIAAAGPLARARKPYCEQCHRWMKRHVTHLDPAEAQTLVDAIRNSSPASLGTLFATPEFTSVPNLAVALDHCPATPEGRPADCPAYLSVKLITANAQGAHLDGFEQARGTMLVCGLQLEPQELSAVMQRWPESGNLTGHTVSPPVPPKVDSSADAPGETVEIRPVAEAFRGRILTKRTALIGNALLLAALIGLFACLGLAAWGGIMAYPDKDSARKATPVERTAGTVMLVVGGLGFLGVAGLFLWEPTLFANRWLENRTRAEFLRRPTLLVRPDDPEAVFVEVVPKLNWGKMSLETAADIGFLRLDRSRHEIHFEGDKECYQIPVNALASCDVEFFVEGRGTAAATKLYFLVLRAPLTGRTWEAPIRRRGETGIFRGRNRRKWAESTAHVIEEMRE